jgi:plastocyanin
MIYSISKEIVMSCLLRRLALAPIIILLVAIPLASCDYASSSVTSSSKSAQSAPSVTIPLGQELFMPFIQVIRPRTTLTWQNQDSHSHTVMTTWDHSSFLNPEPFSLIVAPGKKASFTFTTPGIYDYFDNTQARWDGSDHRVVANKGGPLFPLAMEGIVWVQGSITGLPSTATNIIPGGKDEFSTDFIAIAQNGSMTWRNHDTDAHFVSLVDGWDAPVNAASLGVVEVKGTQDAPPVGGTATIQFHNPGLYYYYCTAHAAVNSSWHRAQALKVASEYPVPMEGFVLVGGA